MDKENVPPMPARERLHVDFHLSEGSGLMLGLPFKYGLSRVVWHYCEIVRDNFWKNNKL